MPLTVYFLSFILIGVVWINHRRIVAHLRDIDGIGTAINLVLLSQVAQMPVVIRFALSDPGQDGAFVVYASAVTVTFSCMTVLWAYVAFIANPAPDLERGLPGIWLLEMIAAPLIVGAMAALSAACQIGGIDSDVGGRGALAGQDQDGVFAQAKQQPLRRWTNAPVCLISLS